MIKQQAQKLDRNSKDIMGENLEKLKALFPSVVKDGMLDVEALKNVLGDISESHQEYYNFTWAGKSQAFKIIKEKSTATLKPQKSEDESVNFDNTQNIFIEGDNLEVLKILQKTYHNAIKMIYIDPPYNKDKDFVYPDKWSEGLSSYLEYARLVDEDGNITSSSAEEKSVKQGRKHSRWLTMMYPRLFLARNLLKEDGVIFISIDDDEVKNLRNICDEIFGEENFVANFLWKKKSTTSNTKGTEVSSQMDYTLCYKKSDKAIIKRRIKAKETRSYTNSDEEGNFRTTVIEKKDSGAYKRDTMKYEIIGYIPREGKRWQIGKEIARELEKKNRFIFDGEKILLKIYDYEDEDTSSAQPNILDNFGSTNSAAQYLNDELFQISELFDNPKPVDLISHFINLSTNEDDIVLDFFAGSGTTVESSIRNNRKSIAVQLPEMTNKKSEAYKNGYKKISEITKERIRRAGTKIVEENPNTTIDIGFKVFKLSESNFKQWDDSPKSKEELSLAFDDYKDNVKEGADQLDMLYEVILAKGLSLNSKVEKLDVYGKTMFKVDSDTSQLLACFEEEISKVALDEVVNLRPLYFICLDSSFKSDSSLKTNAVLNFKDADILFETV